MCFILDLHQYFVKQGFSNLHHAALHMCTSEVVWKAASESVMWQTTLDSFML